MKITAEIVNGKCPTCDECMNCGTDLEQYINGKISYLPHITRPEHMDVFVKEWSE